MSFEPEIVAFCCNWCSYQGADLAGTSRKKYPPNLKIVRVMCTGRVDPQFVLRALVKGADGVLIAGCHPGGCHYKEGNLKCEERYNRLKEFTSILGIEDDRIRLEWISASEGGKFAQVAEEFTQTVKGLGPLRSRAVNAI